LAAVDIDELIASAEIHPMTGGMYFAEIPGMFGIWGHGATEEESLDSLRANLETHIGQLEDEE
jgi:predicted RNase H-like HicB family nuclease